MLSKICKNSENDHANVSREVNIDFVASSDGYRV